MRLRVLAVFSALFTALLTAPASAKSPVDDGRVHVKYWEKWTGFEKEAMRSIVDDFNRSQTRIFVEYVSVSKISQKTLVAIAGGNPPDLAGVMMEDVVGFADKNALIPLDDFARGTPVTSPRYLPLFWNMGLYAGKLYGLISVPTVAALHWNKRLFREAGLDPERPPGTIAELDEFARKLTRVENGKIEQIGFLPSEPVWWNSFWVYPFHGKLWDGGANIVFDSPENVRAFEWIQGYAKLYGVSALQNMSEAFGNFASPQNPFLSEKLAMIFHGVYLSNFIDKYAPGMDWGVAPLPSVDAGNAPVTFVDADMLVIPRGSRHPAEAFEFIRFMSEQRNVEKLCLLQRKNSPLRDVSEEFFERHEHPYIRLFQSLAASPRAASIPPLSIWNEYHAEAHNAFQRVWLMQASPKQALGDARARLQKSWDRARARNETRPSPWLAAAPFLLLGLLLAGIVVSAIAEQRRKRAVLKNRKSVRSNVSLAKGLLFFSPWGIGLLLFTAYPVMASLVYSFCDYSVLSAPRFVGLQNFLELFGDEVFFIALKNTLVYALFALPLSLLFSLSIALLLDANVRGSGFYRTLVFLPSLTPLVASAMVWLWIFNGRYGLLNYAIGKLSFGLIEPVPWLTDPNTALPSLIFMSLWSVGQTVVILLAALQDVPTAIYEAADIDGATLLQKVRHITVPLVSPVLYFNGIISVIGALQVFAQPFIMTEGGPARSTLTYTMRLYENAFGFLRMGFASAMAWILFLIILGLTALAVRLGKSRVHYTGV